MGPSSLPIPIIAVVNSRLVRANEKDGDAGAAWLASNEAGSGAYAFVSGSLTTLEALDMVRFRRAFPRLEGQPEPGRPRRHPRREGNLDRRARAAEWLDRLDRQLPADRPGRTSPKAKNVLGVIQDETMRVMVIRMNNRAAVQQCAFPPRHLPCLQLQGIHPGVLKDYADTQCRADPAEPVGSTEGSRADYGLRSGAGQGGACQGQGRGCAHRARGGDPHPTAAGADHTGGAGAAAGPAQDRRQPQDRAEPVGQLVSSTAKPDTTPICGCIGSVDLFRRPRELGRPDVRQPVPRHLEGLELVQECQGRQLLGEARTSTDQAERRRSTRKPRASWPMRRHLGLQHGAATRRQQPRPGLPLLPGGRRLRNAAGFRPEMISASSCSGRCWSCPRFSGFWCDLPADPEGAVGSGRGDGRRRRDAGADRRDPPAIRSRPAAAGAVLSSMSARWRASISARAQFSRRPVAPDIAQRLPATLELTFAALLSTGLGVPLGVVPR